VGVAVAGDLMGEVLPEMAKDVYDRWANGKPPEQVRAELEAIARTSDADARNLAALVVHEEAPMQPEALQLKLITYLA
jgi:hypothetical protein